ncbi:regulatory signaling modulator protein AmpE [Pseudoalteromonas sp. MMG007]|uniref:cobalamin biosynthesis protein CobD/CbiB n=1 Tax=Pseudoalteromonas sp. MMG007 TaxID=2822684 RepID=UPI001B35D0B7|nr:regulatory signaling modulator protein AmpE [Pseudoalteromonas sp. MMG007]MBQ4858775.1 regulatory signaling modulator protein AmpE [Pseudoalteromonas sp. MMG007]
MLSNIVQNHLDFVAFIIALLAERFFPLVSWYHPNTVLTAVFSAIGKRIYKPSEPKSYLYLASILACTLVLSVILIILVLLLEFAFYPDLLAGLILYLCLESKAIDKKALRIAKLVKQNQKSTARELLKPLLAREVNKLSAPGIIKALIESLILRTARNYFVVIFIFLLFGPIAALAYRLLTLMQQAWRTDISPNSHFLKPLKILLYIIEFIPIRLLALTIAASKASKQSMHYIKHYGRHFYQKNTGWILSACSASLGVQLGGPAVYFGERFNKMRISNERLPKAEDVPVIINRLNQARAFWLLVIISIEILKLI